MMKALRKLSEAQHQAASSAAGAADTVPAERQHLADDRDLYWRIGNFLFEHALAPTPDYYALAHLYLLRLDPGVVAGIEGAIDGGQRLPRAVADSLVTSAGIGALPSAAFDRIAEETQAHFDRAAGLVDRSHQEARSFGDAIAANAADLTQHPIDPPTVAALVDLAQAMLASTRYAEERLRRTAGEMAELRLELDAARADADTDPLTALPNRRAFDRAFCAARDRSAVSGAPLVLGIVDVDRFKGVNDSHGHQVGDRVLQLFARTLAEACAPHPVARRGGEEFALMFDGLDLAHAFALIDAARETMAARTLRVAETRRALGRLTFSGGVVAFDGTETCEAMMRRADTLLYHAKNAGRNRLAT